jgi:hypothetical protein
VSIKPGWYVAPQLKYLMSGTSGVSSLNLRICSTVRHSKALPSPPPFGSRSRRERTCGKRSRPTVSKKWSAKEEPRCGEAIVVIERMRKSRSVKWVARYRQSSPPYEFVSIKLMGTSGCSPYYDLMGIVCQEKMVNKRWTEHTNKMNAFSSIYF